MSTPEPHTQTITRCAAGRGWLWWVEAFRMVMEAIVPWYWIGLGYLGIFIVPSVLISMAAAADARMSFIGYLPTIIAPCFTVGFVAAGWSQARGGTPQFSHLFNGFKADVKTLLGVGAVTMVTMWLAARIGAMVLGGDFATMLGSIDTKDPMAILAFWTSAPLLKAAFAYAALMTLAWMAAWLAPMVVVFQHTGVAAAMLSSLKALLANWRALSVYALVPIVGSLAFSMVLGFVMTALALVVLGGGGEAGASILPLFVWGLLLPIIPLLVSLGSLTAFVAYCDIFHTKDAVFPRPPKVK